MKTNKIENKILLFFKQIGGEPSSAKYGAKPLNEAKPLDTPGLTIKRYFPFWIQLRSYPRYNSMHGWSHVLCMWPFVVKIEIAKCIKLKSNQTRNRLVYFRYL